MVCTCVFARRSSSAIAPGVTERLGTMSRSGGSAANASSENCGHPEAVTALRAPVSFNRSSKYVASPATYSGSVHTANITDGDLERFRRCRSSRSEEHTSELQSRQYLVCRLLLEKK